MFAVKLRNGASVNRVLLTVILEVIDELLSISQAEKSAEGAFAVGFLTRLVKEWTPINEPGALALFKRKVFIHPNGELDSDIRNIIDAAFEGRGVMSRRVNPLATE